MISVGIIGYGYWGPNLARNFADLPEAKVVAVCDLDSKRRSLVERRQGGGDSQAGDRRQDRGSGEIVDRVLERVS